MMKVKLEILTINDKAIPEGIDIHDLENRVKGAWEMLLNIIAGEGDRAFVEKVEIFE